MSAFRAQFRCAVASLLAPLLSPLCFLLSSLPALAQVPQSGHENPKSLGVERPWRIAIGTYSRKNACSAKKPV